MKYNLGLENVKNGLELLFFFEDKESDNKIYKTFKERGNFSGKLGEVIIYRDLENVNKVALLGLGKKEELTIDKIRRAFFNLGKEMQNKNEEEIRIEIPKLNDLCTKRTYNAVLEGIYQSEYVFDKYLSKKSSKKEITVNFFVREEKFEKVKLGLANMYNIMEGVFLTRDLVNTPAQDLYPESLANIVVEKLSNLGVNVKVYDEKEIEKIGMKAFLSVGRASVKKPRLIVMEYLNDENSSEKVALVGKGVTYDTGGYSLKPNDGMVTMFCDMGGAGTVIGTLYSLAKNKVKTNVIGIVAACENAIDGGAYKPGDIIGSLSGKSIEIVNTDAEGRLTLADAVYYATTELKADKVIDLATLTGACLVALSEYSTGSVTNNQEFFNSLQRAGEKSGELIWQLPVTDEYKQLNRSLVADIKNSGGRMAGTISAGLFIGEFNNDKPWVHLDIAGTAYLSKSYGYLPKGATGIHVKTLVEYFENNKTCNC